MTNKILMICSSFYPNGSVVEGKNNYFTALEFEKSGFEVDVCTFGDFDDSCFVKYKANKNRNTIFDKYYRTLRTLVRLPISHVSFSDTQCFLKSLSSTDMSKYKFVYTVFGGGSEHIVGMELKRMYPHLKHVAEFRDPWVHNQIAKDFIFDNSITAYAKFIWARLQRQQAKLLKNVDLLLVESQGHAKGISSDFNYDKKILICNGYSDLFSHSEIKLSIDFLKRPIIGFIGNTYYGYENIIERFLSVLHELEAEGVDFTFISVGDNYFSKNSYRQELNNYVSFSKVSYDRSLAYIDALDYGLAIIGENYDTINSKIFDHMKKGKYTIALSPVDGVMDRMLRSSNAGESISYNKVTMKSRLKHLLSASQPPAFSQSDVAMYDRANVFRSIIKEMEEL